MTHHTHAATETEFVRTLDLLEARGLPVRYIDRRSVLYFLNVEHRTPEQIVSIVVKPGLEKRAQ